jgi:N-acetylglucosaminyl-diphospho-decaprenol L-rhamnosyltransferase
MRKIFIIIPVFNRINLTQKCLLSLKNQSYNNIQIIIVDDGSTDGTSEMIKKDFPAIVLLSGNGNLWWTGSVNLGLKYAMENCEDNDFIILLNDDVVVDQNYCEILLNKVIENKDSIIGSIEIKENNTEIIKSGGIKYNWYSAKCTDILKGKNIKSLPKDLLVNVSTLPGRGVIYPVSVFKKIGLFDDIHFKQCGDFELPTRALRKGFNLYVYVNSIVKTIYPDTLHMNEKKYDLKDFKQYFFGIKSNCNLKYEYYLAFNTRKNLFQFLIFYICSALRIIFHFFANLR